MINSCMASSITVSVHVVGMSGKLWIKTGTFNDPEAATNFIVSSWKDLSWPQHWTLSIDGYEYDSCVTIHTSYVREHIDYCLDLHEAFYNEPG
jgi:hypothetical protein